MKSAISLKDMLAAESPEMQAAVEVRHRELVAEIEGLKALRDITGLSQKEIANSMGVKQPVVHRIEHQADNLISTVRRYVEAAGGTLEISVSLPGHPKIIVNNLGDLRE